MKSNRILRESKTLKNVVVTEIHFVKDESEQSEVRANEVKNLIAQMIELSHKRGRPTKINVEILDAA